MRVHIILAARLRELLWDSDFLVWVLILALVLVLALLVMPWLDNRASGRDAELAGAKIDGAP